MACLLKQSTAVEIKLGPFLDEDDGKTAEDALTIEDEHVDLAKNGGDWGDKAETTTLVHESQGWYRCLLGTDDTDTLGILIVKVHVSGALPVWREFMVVPANVYDSLVGGSDALQVHANEITANLITATAINDGALTAAKFASDCITAAKLASDVTTELQNGLATATALATAQTDLDTLTGSDGVTLATSQPNYAPATAASLSTVDGKIDTIDGIVDSILEDTGTTLDGKIDTIDGIVDAILLDTAEIGSAGAGLTEAGGTGDQLTGVPWNASWDTEVQSEVQDAIEVNQLDHLIQVADPGSIVANSSLWAKLHSKSATPAYSSYANTTDSLEAIRDKETDIETDTNELQTDLTNGGRLDLLIDAIKAATDLLNSAQSEPTGVPAANETPIEKIGRLYMMHRNRVDVTAAKKQFYDDGGNLEFEKDLSDNGTVYSESEVNAP